MCCLRFTRDSLGAVDHPVPQQQAPLALVSIGVGGSEQRLQTAGHEILFELCYDPIRAGQEPEPNLRAQAKIQVKMY